MRAPKAWTVLPLLPLTLVLLMAGGMLMDFLEHLVPLTPGLERFVSLTGLALLEFVAVLGPVALFTWWQQLRLGEVAPFRRVSGRRLAAIALGTLGLALAVTYLQSWFADLTHLDYPESLQELIRATGPWDGLLLLASVAVIPALIEETFTRGYVQSALVPRLGTVFGILASAGIFTILHWTPAGAPTYLLLGVWLSVLRWRTGSLVGCVLAHSLNNVLAILQENYVPEPVWIANVAWVLPLGIVLAGIGGYFALRPAEIAP